jgi:signal transduction histidine kinase
MSPIASHLKSLKKQYLQALEAYLGGEGEVALQRAYELGRQAMAGELGILDMIALHHEALASLLLAAPPAEGCIRTRKGTEFLMQCLSPYEMTHRAYGEATRTLRRLNEILEEEAKRIAHALHDEAGQLLVSAHIALAEISADLPDPLRERLQETRGLLYQIERRLRELSHELRPAILDDLGLVPAIEFLAQGVSKRAGFPIAVDDETAGRLPPRIETALYRIIQEALTNVTKHASATHVRIRLAQDNGRILCSIQDDGKGFDAAAVLAGQAPRGLGLVGMRERLHALGGTMQVSSAPSHGTEIFVTVPVEV